MKPSKILKGQGFCLLSAQYNDLEKEHQWKQEEDTEIPISCLSYTFKGAELNYTHIDRQAFTIYKYVKHFRPCLLKSKVKVIVPYASIRNFLIQKELREKHAHWMTALHEYDLEINRARIVKGQGFCLLASQSNDP